MDGLLAPDSWPEHSQDLKTVIFGQCALKYYKNASEITAKDSDIVEIDRLVRSHPLNNTGAEFGLNTCKKLMKLLLPIDMNKATKTGFKLELLRQVKLYIERGLVVLRTAQPEMEQSRKRSRNQSDDIQTEEPCKKQRVDEAEKNEKSTGSTTGSPESSTKLADLTKDEKNPDENQQVLSLAEKDAANKEDAQKQIDDEQSVKGKEDQLESDNVKDKEEIGTELERQVHEEDGSIQEDTPQFEQKKKQEELEKSLQRVDHDSKLEPDEQEEASKTNSQEHDEETELNVDGKTSEDQAEPENSEIISDDTSVRQENEEKQNNKIETSSEPEDSDKSSQEEASQGSAKTSDAESEDFDDKHEQEGQQTSNETRAKRDTDDGNKLEVPTEGTIADSRYVPESEDEKYIEQPARATRRRSRTRRSARSTPEPLEVEASTEQVEQETNESKVTEKDARLSPDVENDNIKQETGEHNEDDPDANKNVKRKRSVTFDEASSPLETFISGLMVDSNLAGFDDISIQSSSPIILSPTSLPQILTQVQNKELASLNDVEAELLKMIANSFVIGHKDKTSVDAAIAAVDSALADFHEQNQSQTPTSKRRKR